MLTFFPPIFHFQDLHGQVLLKILLPPSNLYDQPLSLLEGPLRLQISPPDLPLPRIISPMMSPCPAVNLPSNPQLKHVSGCGRWGCVTSMAWGNVKNGLFVLSLFVYIFSQKLSEPNII